MWIFNFYIYLANVDIFQKYLATACRLPFFKNLNALASCNGKGNI